MVVPLELDLDVDIGRQVETHQRVDGLGRRVDDVDETLAKAEAAGGKALYPPMDVPGVGRMCALTDKGGAVVSIITYEDKEST